MFMVVDNFVFEIWDKFGIFVFNEVCKDEVFVKCRVGSVYWYVIVGNGVYLNSFG